MLLHHFAAVFLIYYIRPTVLLFIKTYKRCTQIQSLNGVRTANINEVRPVFYSGLFSSILLSSRGSDIARRHGHVFRMALHNEGDWRMET